MTGAARVTPETVRITSESETLQADLYGMLPSTRAVILVHGASWDATGWRDVAPLFAERGLPALALNLRGFDGSTGKTNRWGETWSGSTPAESWSPVADLRAAKALLRARGAAQLALVGASMGGHAILASSFDSDVECIVSVSAPVVAVADELSRRITGRKLFVCADGDTFGAAPHVRRCFDIVSRPKTLIMFGGEEHSRGMFATPYGAEALEAIIAFVARGL